MNPGWLEYYASFPRKAQGCPGKFHLRSYSVRRDHPHNFFSARPACTPRDCRAALAMTLPCHCEERSDEAISQPQVSVQRIERCVELAIYNRCACYCDTLLHYDDRANTTRRFRQSLSPGFCRIQHARSLEQAPAREADAGEALVVARALRIEGDRAARRLAEQIEKACRAAL